MKNVLTHTLGGIVEVDIEGPGHVDMWSMPAAGPPVHIGLYDDEVVALDNIEYLLDRGHRPGRWVITSAAPGERLVPCFAAGGAGAAIVGQAATRAQARAVLGCEVAYRADGYGPDGNEGWEPA